ncbi:MAG: hypothetical protein DCE90_12085 [Pseudanabaena sp.]|nr:MAG: hypothetical protein DCE90_12085 [Pseudanabaena sp.]
MVVSIFNYNPNFEVLVTTASPIYEGAASPRPHKLEKLNQRGQIKTQKSDRGAIALLGFVTAS